MLERLQLCGKLCYDQQVRDAFKGGVCFMEFGKSVSEPNVTAELQRCVRNLGGESVAAEMSRAESVEEAIERVSEWVRDKIVLYVCDDLWPSDCSNLGYAPRLKKLLRNAPRRTLLISTRDQIMARGAGSKSIELQLLAAHGATVRETLLRAVFGEGSDPDLSGVEAETSKHWTNAETTVGAFDSWLRCWEAVLTT